MRWPVILFLFTLAPVARGQIFRSRGDPNACDDEPLRSTAIGASFGAAAILGEIVIRDPRHGLAPDARFAAAWGLTAGAVVAGGVAHALVAHRCRAVVIRDDLRPCARAAWRGAAIGTVASGATGFAIAPVLLLPLALKAAFGRRPAHFQRDMGAVAVTGAAIGLPVGAVTAYRDCKGY